MGCQEVNIEEQVDQCREGDGVSVVKKAKGSEGEDDVFSKQEVIFICQVNGDDVGRVEARGCGSIEMNREDQE